MNVMRILPSSFVIVTAFILNGCNPFAPRLYDQPVDDFGLQEQFTTEAIFSNFRYSYNFKDTISYGRLLSPEFTFIYRNYDKGIDVTWGKDQDMISTFGLFQASQSLDLSWNNVVIDVGDSLVKDISRGFTLTVIFSANDVVRIDGRANFRLGRASSSDEWKIIRWRDESNF